MTGLDISYIDKVLEGWEAFKIAHGITEELIAEGNEIIREAKNAK